MFQSRDKSAKWEDWFGFVLAIGFPALMLKFNAGGVDTGEVFIKVLGFIMIASIVIAVIAFVAVAAIRIGSFIFGK